MKREVFFTFYAQCTDKVVARYFTDVLMASSQSQVDTLTEMVRFCKENGFEMPKKETAYDRERKRHHEKIMVLKSRKKMMRG